MAKRLSTQVSHSFERRYGIKPTRAMMDVYDRSLVRLTIPTALAGVQFAGECKRQIARDLFKTIPSKTWIYLNPMFYPEKGA